MRVAIHLGVDRACRQMKENEFIKGEDMSGNEHLHWSTLPDDPLVSQSLLLQILLFHFLS